MNPPAVHFQFFLSGSAGSDPAAQPGKRTSQTFQMSRTVTKLCQFHLDLSFTGHRVSGKNIQDHQGSVHHLQIQFLLEIVHLSRGKFIVTDNSRGFQSVRHHPDLLDLALSDICARMDPFSPLDHRADDFCPGSLHQFAQLIDGIFRIVSRLFLDTHQDQPFCFFF